MKSGLTSKRVNFRAPHMIKLHSIFLITSWSSQASWVCLDLFDWHLCHFSVSFVALVLVGINGIFITIICSCSDLQFPSSIPSPYFNLSRCLKSQITSLDGVWIACHFHKHYETGVWTQGTIDTAYYVLRFIESKDNPINLKASKEQNKNSPTKTNFKQAWA